MPVAIWVSQRSSFANWSAILKMISLILSLGHEVAMHCVQMKHFQYNFQHYATSRLFSDLPSLQVLLRDSLDFIYTIQLVSDSFWKVDGIYSMVIVF